jgi:hypothetical protein
MPLQPLVTALLRQRETGRAHLRLLLLLLLLAVAVIRQRQRHLRQHWWQQWRL